MSVIATSIVGKRATGFYTNSGQRLEVEGEIAIVLENGVWLLDVDGKLRFVNFGELTLPTKKPDKPKEPPKMPTPGPGVSPGGALK